MMPNVQIEVHEVLVTGQHVPSFPFFEKVNAVDIVVFEKNELLCLLNLWFQKRANPGNEGQRLILEKEELFYGFPKDKVGYFHSQVIWKLFHESFNVIDIVFELISYRLFDILV